MTPWMENIKVPIQNSIDTYFCQNKTYIAALMDNQKKQSLKMCLFHYFSHLKSCKNLAGIVTEKCSCTKQRHSGLSLKVDFNTDSLQQKLFPIHFSETSPVEQRH